MEKKNRREYSIWNYTGGTKNKNEIISSHKSKILEESTLLPALSNGCYFSSLLLPRYAVVTLQMQSYLQRYKNNGTHTSRKKVAGRKN